MLLTVYSNLHYYLVSKKNNKLNSPINNRFLGFFGLKKNNHLTGPQLNDAKR
ncbi:hypothetical protein PTUN_b0166 [Pseudoalteromonas tunicata]|nr:hypothetical protein PTUN_b0166 [Pseudoalteromonas tunicata]